MPHCELDSFVLKSKNLWVAGRNANLRIKSIKGKAEVHLSVELGDALRVTSNGPTSQSKNIPSRQQRRVRRAAARESAKAEEANNVAEAAIVSKDSDIADEFCEDVIYNSNVEENTNKDENLIEQVLVAKEGAIPFDKETLENKLESVGIKVI